MDDETRVIVTFLAPGAIDLRARGISEEQAADLSARLRAFAEEWDGPEMDLYNDYDAAKATLYARLYGKGLRIDLNPFSFMGTLWARAIQMVEVGVRVRAATPTVE